MGTRMLARLRAHEAAARLQALAEPLLDAYTGMSTSSSVPDMRSVQARMRWCFDAPCRTVAWKN